MLAAKALAAAVSQEPAYIEDVFSTYLYTGNSSTQTITNGIDLSGRGGLVWLACRSNANGHLITDTNRGLGASSGLQPSSTSAGVVNNLSSFNANGFGLNNANLWNLNAETYVSWTFREQPKFFDIVTWTGNGGTSGRTITHNLGSAPGCIIVKKTSSAEDWYVYHRSLGNTGVNQYFCVLNTTAAQDTGGFGMEKASNWTATQFALSSGSAALNTNGETYVAYIFAHDAGGFGLSGSDNVISCGSYTGSASPQSFTLGWEPQLVLIKCSSTAGTPWIMLDTTRGWSASTGLINRPLYPNTSAAESVADFGWPTATGFYLPSAGDVNSSGRTYIYIAIRRGPMKVPTSGTQVYTPIARTGTNTNATISGVGFSPDLVLGMTRSTSNQSGFVDRLRGINPTAVLRATQTSSETSLTTADNLGVTSLTMDGVTLDGDQTFGYINFSSRTFSTHFFRRAPGFFDEVCYTGTGSNTTQTHNLGAVPELMIIKLRSAAGAHWAVYASGLANTEFLHLDATDAKATNTGYWNSTTPTSSVFSVGANGQVNQSADTYVAYLFATVAGVSKVGSYTGTGTTKQIDCGFTAGARFVLIKRTDSTGDWYVWDSARGIVAGNDPYLLLNSTAAEVTSTDYVDTYSAGFELSNTAPAAINANGGTFIFLAIA